MCRWAPPIERAQSLGRQKAVKRDVLAKTKLRAARLHCAAERVLPDDIKLQRWFLGDDPPQRQQQRLLILDAV